MYKAHTHITPSAIPQGNAGGIFCSPDTMKQECISYINYLFL